jgi:hypothetical protein
VHSADVGRFGFTTHQDDLLPSGDTLLRFFRGERDLANRGAR